MKTRIIKGIFYGSIQKLLLLKIMPFHACMILENNKQVEFW